MFLNVICAECGASLSHELVTNYRGESVISVETCTTCHPPRAIAAIKTLLLRMRDEDPHLRAALPFGSPDFTALCDAYAAGSRANGSCDRSEATQLYVWTGRAR